MQEFSAGTDPCAHLEPKDKSEVTDTKLVECLDKMVDENPCARSEEPIISYFTNSSQVLKNREAVGVLKTLSSLKLGTCKRYDGVVVSFLNHTKKTGSQDSNDIRQMSGYDHFRDLLIVHGMTWCL